MKKLTFKWNKEHLRNWDFNLYLNLRFWSITFYFQTKWFFIGWAY